MEWNKEKETHKYFDLRETVQVFNYTIMYG